MKPFVKQTFQFVGFLACVQMMRALIHWGLWMASDAAENNNWQQVVDMVSYISVGGLLLLIFHPTKESLGLVWNKTSQREKSIYFILAGLLAAGVLSTWFMDSSLILENLKAVVVVPVFEELIFRGWGWKQIEDAVSGKHARIWCWLTTSILFALWHIGYTDIFFLRILPRNPGATLIDFLIGKVVFTFFFGLAVGAVRIFTKKTYGSLLLHGFLNLFGK